MSIDDPGLVLSGFGDEIDPDPRVQTAVLRALGAQHIEVRSAWGVNVVDLTPDQLSELGAIIGGCGMRVSAIGSPVGKADVRDPADVESDRLHRAIAAAHVLGAGFIRVFSFYHPGVDASSVRGAVMEAMAAFAATAEREGVTLVLENEEGLYGDIPQRLADVVETVGSSALAAAWDPANYVGIGVRPFDDAYPLLRNHFAYLQVKDVRVGETAMTVAGAGDGQIRETVRALRQAGFSGFASMEPHLAQYTDRGGFSGPAEFGRATRAFVALAAEEGMALR